MVSWSTVMASPVTCGAPTNAFRAWMESKLFLPMVSVRLHAQRLGQWNPARALVGDELAEDLRRSGHRLRPDGLELLDQLGLLERLVDGLVQFVDDGRGRVRRCHHAEPGAGLCVRVARLLQRGHVRQ